MSLQYLLDKFKKGSISSAWDDERSDDDNLPSDMPDHPGYSVNPHFSTWPREFSNRRTPLQPTYLTAPPRFTGSGGNYPQTWRPGNVEPSNVRQQRHQGLPPGIGDDGLRSSMPVHASHPSFISSGGNVTTLPPDHILPAQPTLPTRVAGFGGGDQTAGHPDHLSFVRRRRPFAPLPPESTDHLLEAEPTSTARAHDLAGYGLMSPPLEVVDENAQFGIIRHPEPSASIWRLPDLPSQSPESSNLPFRTIDRAGQPATSVFGEHQESSVGPPLVSTGQIFGSGIISHPEPMPPVQPPAGPPVQLPEPTHPPRQAASASAQPTTTMVLNRCLVLMDPSSSANRTQSLLAEFSNGHPPSWTPGDPTPSHFTSDLPLWAMHSPLQPTFSTNTLQQTPNHTARTNSTVIANHPLPTDDPLPPPYVVMSIFHIPNLANHTTSPDYLLTNFETKISAWKTPSKYIDAEADNVYSAIQEIRTSTGTDEIEQASFVGQPMIYSVSLLKYSPLNRFLFN